MNWWRAYHGISNNAKLSVVAAKSGATRSEVGWIWVILLDYASQSEDRGSVEGLDIERIAFMAEMEVTRVESIVEVMIQKGLIENGRLTSWDRRQPDRERFDPTSADRVRRHRERNAMKRHVTPCNAMKRPEEIREEEKRIENSALPVSQPKETPDADRKSVV